MAKSFKKNVGGKISKAEAMAWIEKYENTVRKDKEKDTRSIFYGRDMLLNLLKDESIAGITFFFALKENEAVKKETLHLVLVPRREDGTLVWSEVGEQAARAGGGGEVAYDLGIGCPPYC